SAVNVEIESQRLLLTQRDQVVHICVLLFVLVFDIREVQACTQILVEGIGATNEVVFLQATGVAVGATHGAIGSEVTCVQFQSFNFAAGNHTASEGLRQQARII